MDAVFTNAIESLSDDDKSLAQIQQILPLLKRGIAIHHSVGISHPLASLGVFDPYAWLLPLSSFSSPRFQIPSRFWRGDAEEIKTTRRVARAARRIRT